MEKGFLYLITVFFELLSIVVRFIIAFSLTFTLVLIVLFFGWFFGIFASTVPGFYMTFSDTIRNLNINLLAFVPLTAGVGFAVLPLLGSIHAILGLGSGSLLTRFVLGARRLSTRERAAITEALAEISEVAERNGMGDKIRTFPHIYVLDGISSYAYLIGTTLYISAGAIRSEDLKVLLVHELGHLNHGDGGVILALRRLLFPLNQLLVGGVKDYSTGRVGKKTKLQEFDALQLYYSVINTMLFFVLAFAGGGFGVWLTSWFWAGYFRERDYDADAFVARCGFGDELITFLEQGLFYDTSIPYMAGWQPVNELRIDVLQYPENRSFLATQIAGSGDAGYQEKDLLQRVGQSLQNLPVAETAKRVRQQAEELLTDEKVVAMRTRAVEQVRSTTEELRQKAQELLAADRQPTPALPIEAENQRQVMTQGFVAQGNTEAKSPEPSVAEPSARAKERASGTRVLAEKEVALLEWLDSGSRADSLELMAKNLKRAADIDLQAALSEPAQELALLYGRRGNGYARQIQQAMKEGLALESEKIFPLVVKFASISAHFLLYTDQVLEHEQWDDESIPLIKRLGSILIEAVANNNSFEELQAWCLEIARIESV